jgi:hypothetical protein
MLSGRLTLMDVVCMTTTLDNAYFVHEHAHASVGAVASPEIFKFAQAVANPQTVGAFELRLLEG